MAMTEATKADPREAQWMKWRSVADLYHAYFTGLILTVVTRRGTSDAAEFVFRVFRRQQQERFLPGLEKLGLSHLPPAGQPVAVATLTVGIQDFCGAGRLGEGPKLCSAVLVSWGSLQAASGSVTAPIQTASRILLRMVVPSGVSGTMRQAGRCSGLRP